MTDRNRDDIPDDSELPSYDDVVREDAKKLKQSENPPPPPRRRNRLESQAPPPNARPQTRPQTKPQARPSRPTMAGSMSAPPQRPQLPWVYPNGFFCRKCNNTGYKIKNGHSCKTCWRRFAPVNSVRMVSNIGTPYFNPFSPFSAFGSSYGMVPPPPINGGPQPLILRPGDPRLGGVVCGECRGSGRVSFLLDEDLCPLCRGVGRIIC